jgi:hypothetical protein
VADHHQPFVQLEPTLHSSSDGGKQRIVVPLILHPCLKAICVHGSGAGRLMMVRRQLPSTVRVPIFEDGVVGSVSNGSLVKTQAKHFVIFPTKPRRRLDFLTRQWICCFVWPIGKSISCGADATRQCWLFWSTPVFAARKCAISSFVTLIWTVER